MKAVRAEPPPQARRTRFAPWPGTKLPERVREAGRRGVADARAELARHPHPTRRRPR